MSASSSSSSAVSESSVSRHEADVGKHVNIKLLHFVSCWDWSIGIIQLRMKMFYTSCKCMYASCLVYTGMQVLILNLGLQNMQKLPNNLSLPMRQGLSQALKHTCTFVLYIYCLKHNTKQTKAWTPRLLNLEANTLTIDHCTCQKLAGEKWSAAFFLEKFSIIVTRMFSHQSLKWQTVTGKQLQMDTVTHT